MPKNQVNIYKRLGKNAEKHLIAKIDQVQKPQFRQKSMECNETQTQSVSHGD